MTNNPRTARRSGRAQERIVRVVAFVAIAILVLGAAGYLLAAAFAPKTPPPAATTWPPSPRE